MSAAGYPRPDSPSTIAAPFPRISGCESLAFAPTFTTIATNPEAAAPTGLDATLKIPQDETPQGLATSTLRSATVALPQGFTINSAAGDGLAACSSEEVGFGRNEAAHCPGAAKIGSAELEVPALEHTLGASVYQRTPEPGHLFRFWLVADEQGVHIKLPAEIEANPLTGQLTTHFDGIASLGGNPQVPFEELRLHIFGGPRAPLATPNQCGTYQTTYSFAPWSGRPAASGQTPIQITAGCGKGGFSPKLVAGTASLRAGAFSPLLFTLTRQDGEAEPQTLAIHLPQGLLAKIAGVALCPEGQAGSGACPAASQIGTLTAATGVGGAPLWIPQPGKAPTAAYLAGPYKGAPYSVVSVVPAQVGPFDLGNVVSRAAIYIDPETALATVKTDPLPQFLEGVPVSYRTIHVTVDRKDFTLNPTSCAEKKITATVTATNGQSSEPSVPFQATNCAKLAYKPKLKLFFKGQTKRTGNPAVSAVLTQKPHQANTKAAITLLPGGEFIDNAHINSPCTRVQFNAEKCPKKSILGHVKATSPLLSQPLAGPIYFRSNGGERELPDIVADLRGQIHFTLVGYIDSVKTGPESSRVRVRFLHVPDAPVTSAKFSFFGGKRGLIENSVDICRHRRRASFEFRGQPPMCGICGACAGETGRAPTAEAVERDEPGARPPRPRRRGLFRDEPGAGRHAPALDHRPRRRPPADRQRGRHASRSSSTARSTTIRELRAELEARGHRFATRLATPRSSSTSTRSGATPASSALRGMFALALWDTPRASAGAGPRPPRHQAALLPPRRRRLVLRLRAQGAARAPGRLARRSTRGRSSAYLAFGFVPAPRAIFAEVEKLPPGHTLLRRRRATWRRGATRDRAAGEESDDRLDGRAVRRELRELLDDAVRAHLIADVPVGAFLSGGLDSSASSALASRRADEPLRTFSIGFPRRASTSFRRARLVASTSAPATHELVVRPDAVELLAELVAVLRRALRRLLGRAHVPRLASWPRATSRWSSPATAATRSSAATTATPTTSSYYRGLSPRLTGMIPSLVADCPSRTRRSASTTRPSASSRAPSCRRSGPTMRGRRSSRPRPGPGWPDRAPAAWDPLDLYRARYAETDGAAAAGADAGRRSRHLPRRRPPGQDRPPQHGPLAGSCRVPFLDPKRSPDSSPSPCRPSSKSAASAKKRLLRAGPGAAAAAGGRPRPQAGLLDPDRRLAARTRLSSPSPARSWRRPPSPARACSTPPPSPPSLDRHCSGAGGSSAARSGA